MSKFVDLHVHSEYSALDGLSTIAEIVRETKDAGRTAVALTDHGTCAGHPELQRVCDANEIKPIFGCEIYFQDDRFLRPEPGIDVEESKRIRYGYTHLILLAKNNVGLQNLWALSTEAWRDGGYAGKPRADWDSLIRHREGLICTTACLGGPISQQLLNGEADQAGARLSRLLEIFGEDLYLEVQPNNLPEQVKLNGILAVLGEQYHIPLIAAVDSHYPTQGDHETHKTWMACQTSTSNEDYWHFDPIRTEAQVREGLFYLPEEVVDEAIANTTRIAGECTARIEDSSIPPVYSRQGGAADDAQRMLDECLKGWSKTLGKRCSQEEYQARFEREFELIVSREFAGYFLIVWDYVDYAKSSGILVGPGRGSGGGCLIAYLLGITEVDPLEHDLIFERFLNEGRSGLPDFDLDFPASKRPELQDYLRKKYGDSHVLRIGTHLRYKNKGILQKLFSVLAPQLPATAYGDQKKVAQLITEAEAGEAGLGLSWEALWAQQGDSLAPYRDLYPVVFDYAERLVGRLNSYGRHAAGIVVSTGEPLTDRLPLRGGEDGESMISQFDMGAVEALGHVKLDLLTLRTLDTIQVCVDLVSERRGRKIDVYGWREEYEDPQVWEEIGLGNTLGMFQIETTSGVKLAKQMKPLTLPELADMITLVRPGPMRSGLTMSYLRRRDGREELSYPDPRLETVLDRTHGCMLYQEDIMSTCVAVAGYDLIEADAVQKILGKKKVSATAAAGEKFIDGCIDNGMEMRDAEELWAKMAEFAKYSFNRAHAFAYATIAYWCAWLKTHYPVEFFTAALSTVDQDRCAEFIKDARRLGIQVLPPDINESGIGFKAATLAVRYGLDAIKNVGPKAVAVLEEQQPFSSFEDFLARKTSTVNSGVVLTLAKIGAFDTMVPNRKGLVTRLEAEKDGSASMCVHKEVGFPGPGGLPCHYDWASEPLPVNPRTHKTLKGKPLPKACTKACRRYTAPPPMDITSVTGYTDAEIREIEVEMLGGFLSSTPFDVLDPEDRETLRKNVEDLETAPEGAYPIAAILVSFRPWTDSQGRTMGFMSLGTEASDLDVVVFADQWKAYHQGFSQGSLVLAELRKTARGYNLLSFLPLSS
jgi:DNA polymerase-3 subunit alpha